MSTGAVGLSPENGSLRRRGAELRGGIPFSVSLSDSRSRGMMAAGNHAQKNRKSGHEASIWGDFGVNG